MSSETSKQLTTALGLVLMPFIDAAFFCLYWNEFDVHGAVGHGLGTVNYWTAVGVNLTVSLVLGVFAAAIYSSIRYRKKKLSEITIYND